MMPPRAYLTPGRLAQEYYQGFEWPAHVQAFQDATLELMFSDHVNRQVIEAPVRHGKSVWHSVIVPAWHCVTFPDRLVLGVSYGSSLSDSFARDVLRLVRYAAPQYGLALDPRWTRGDSFRFIGRRGGYDSIGAGGSVSGKGYHYLACDDLVKDDEAARSPTQRATLSKWFFADLITRCEPGAKMSLVMSRRHMSDLSGECLALNAELPEDSKWDHITFKAINHEGHALWPDRFPIEKLRDIQREFELAGRSYMFSSLYQQNPRSDPEACEWPDEYFDSAMFYEELPPNLPVRLKVLACDPSKGATSKSGDYCAIASATLDHNNYLWLEMFLRRMTTPEVIANLAAEIQRQKPTVATIETHGFAEQLLYDVRRELDLAGCRIPIHPFDAGSEPKEVRIRIAISEWLHLHRLRVRDTVGGRLTVNQLKEFPSGEHDDGPDAIAMALALIGDLLL